MTTFFILDPASAVKQSYLVTAFGLILSLGLQFGHAQTSVTMTAHLANGTNLLIG